jgi:hypothetical protein
MSPSVLGAATLSLMSLGAIGFLILSAPEPLPDKTSSPLEIAAPNMGHRGTRGKQLPDRLVYGWREFSAKGKDQAGRVAVFRVLIMPGDYRWDFASDRLVSGPKNQTVDMTARVKGQEIRELLNQSSHVITVGAASMEGAIAEEEQRSLQRARRLASWVAPGLREDIQVYTLNLGRYLGRCPGCDPMQTAPQRRIALIAVTASHPGVDLYMALRDALIDHLSFPFELETYSDFDLEYFERTTDDGKDPKVSQPQGQATVSAAGRLENRILGNVPVYPSEEFPRDPF